VKISKLSIKNFLAVQQDEISLNLADRGLVLIQGDNRDDTSADSNGAGKSTIGDSISWCLYGVTARGETGDAVINNAVKKGCVVNCVVESNDIVYHITRHRKHKQHKNSLQVNDVTNGKSLTRGTDKLTQEVVNIIVGCSYQVFKSAIYAAQDSIPDLPSMTDKFLKEIVEEAAGINRLSMAHDKAKAHLKSQEIKLTKAHNDLDAKKALLKQCTDRHNDLDAKAKNYAGDVKRKITTIEATVKRLKDEIKDLNVKRGTIDVAKTNADIDTLNDQLSGDIKAKGDAEKAKLKADNVKVQASKELAKIMKDAKLKVSNLKKIEDKIGSPCGECGKPYHSADLADITKIAKSKLITVKSDIATAKQALEDANEAVLRAADELLLLSDTTTLIADNKAAVDTLKSELDLVKTTTSDIISIDKSIKEKIDEIDTLKIAKNPYDELSGDELSAINQANKDIKELKKAVDGFTSDVSLASDAVSVFSPAGVRAHVLDTVTPQLNDRTSHYLSVLSDGNISAVWNTLSKTKSGELREKFTIEVENDNGSKNFGGLSGGEKRKVRLATAMALQDLVASRASKPVSLWVADEIDDALDDAGLERLMTLLEEKAKEKGTVLMISHNSLSDWIRSETTITKEGGRVTVSGDLVAD